MPTGIRVKQLATWCVGIGLLIAGFDSAATAQHEVSTPAGASALYERGVKAYFAGRSSEAEGYLSQALASNPEDPRYYYFRALTLLRSGRTDEARGDMLVGAEVEARAAGRFAVGAALERVQGAHRLILEQFRQRARDQNSARAVRLQQPTQPQVQTSNYANNRAVLRERVLAPLERFNGRGRVESPEHRSAKTSPPGPRRSLPSDSAKLPRNVRPVDLTADGDPFRDDLPAESDPLPSHRRVDL